MSQKTLISVMQLALEEELVRQVSRLHEPHTLQYHEMLTYHMGWTGEGAGPEATGKRLRPLLVLLCAAAAGGDWKKALPGAAAVELVHNFSLIHDDIQDRSQKRRGRSTVWMEWGVAQAINAGDGLFVLSNLAITDLAQRYPAETALKAAQILHNTCLNLTRGQFLDISYEKRNDLSESDYWPMIDGKTAALLAGCCRIGAILGDAPGPIEEAYHYFGHCLGLAFQVEDDILGIWGDESVTGKSAASDLLDGKKSLPVLYGLGQKQGFAKRWEKGPITEKDVKTVVKMLDKEGAKDYAQEKSAQITQDALKHLGEAKPTGDAGAALKSLTEKLLARKS